jgi:hypothetical protein
VLVVLVAGADPAAGAEALHPANTVFGFFFAGVLRVEALSADAVFFAGFSSSPGFWDGVAAAGF